VGLAAGGNGEVALGLARGEGVTVAVGVVRVVVSVGGIDGLGVRLRVGDNDGEEEGDGVSCWSGAAADSGGQASASSAPSARASRAAPRPMDCFACQIDFIARVIILMLFYVKIFISCLILYPNLSKAILNGYGPPYPPHDQQKNPGG
jgi:hypothetical protein